MTRKKILIAIALFIAAIHAAVGTFTVLARTILVTVIQAAIGTFTLAIFLAAKYT